MSALNAEVQLPGAGRPCQHLVQKVQPLGSLAMASCSQNVQESKRLRLADVANWSAEDFDSLGSTDLDMEVEVERADQGHLLLKDAQFARTPPGYIGCMDHATFVQSACGFETHCFVSGFEYCRGMQDQIYSTLASLPSSVMTKLALILLVCMLIGMVHGGRLFHYRPILQHLWRMD